MSSASQDWVFRQAFDTATGAMLIADSSGSILAANAAAGWLFGSDATELCGLAVEDLLVQRDRNSFSRYRAERAARGVGHETRALRHDGTEFAAEIRLAPIENGYIVATIQDLAEKEGEAAMRAARDEAERRRTELQTTLETLSEGVIACDPEGNVRQWNRAALEMHGYATLEEAQRRLPEFTEIFELIDAEGKPVPFEQWPMPRILRGETLRKWEAELRRRDSDWRRTMSYSGALARDAGGRAVLAVLSVADITAYNQAQALLEKTRDQLKAFIQHAPISIAMFDRNMNYLATSGRWLTEYGRGCADLVGRNHYEVHPDIAPEWKRVHQEALGGATLKNDEDMWIQADGSRHWLRWAVLPWTDEEGAIGGIIIAAEDITDRKRAEAELREARAELGEMLALQVASQTAAAIAHEVNQPLNAVASYIGAALRLLRARGNADPAKLAYALERSAEQAQRAGRVTRELLEYLHKGESVAEAVDLNEVVREALAIVEGDGYGGFHAAIDLAPQLPRVKANRLQVEKVLVNLVRNGVEAMRGAGIEIQRISILVSTAAETDMALVTVRDSGPGLDRQAAHRIFEPFYTTKAKGIGMGLAISRSLIESQGGKLWADLDAGPGATFHFTLPFAR